MIHHIDVSSILRSAVSDVYSDLVTRPTGAAVRGRIEQELAATADRLLIVIDFSRVGLLDFSCADEVVAKLLLRYAAPDAPRDVYFLVRGVSESHLDAIEAVLERHALAAVVQLDDGATRVVGAVTEEERQAWEALCVLGAATAAGVEAALGDAVTDVAVLLERLARRRLAIRRDGGWIAVGGQP